MPASWPFRRGMALRKRVSLAAAAAVAAAIALAVTVCYTAVRMRLHSELDSQLTLQAHAIENGYTMGQSIPSLSASAGGPAPYEQLVLPNGVTSGSDLPATGPARAVATGEMGPHFSTVSVNGTDVRTYTFGVNTNAAGFSRVAVVLGRSLSQTNSILSELRLILAVVFFLGVPLAWIFGRFAARRVLKPLNRFTDTVQLIGETDDLTRRIDVHSDDEVGELASRFNTMLGRLSASRAALDDSVQSQRQLVADASHELRTPVTSLRTNVEVLLASPTLDPEDKPLLEDVLEQSEELTALVADLIEVARDEIAPDSFEDIRLDHLVAEALVRSRRHTPQIDFRETLAPVLVHGSPEHLARAVNNLLDNAAKHSGGGSVDVTVDAGGFTVRDHGAGIDPKDLPYVFDRFYRGVNSRSTQGSGLGLAIVKQTAEMHGGSITAANAPDGGAVFALLLPEAEIEPDPPTEPVSGVGDEAAEPHRPAAPDSGDYRGDFLTRL